VNNIIDLSAARAKKQIAEQLAAGRTPLYVSHHTGKVSGTPGFPADDFATRLHRIRASLLRINLLMLELRHNSLERK